MQKNESLFMGFLRGTWCRLFPPKTIDVGSRWALRGPLPHDVWVQAVEAGDITYSFGRNDPKQYWSTLPLRKFVWLYRKAV